MKRDPKVRFFRFVRKDENGCWIWTGSYRKGYAVFTYDGLRSGYGHRFAFKYIRGQELIDGLHLDHLCDQPACVNPWHLRQVTPKENILRGTGEAAKNKAKIVCIRGHSYSPENTYVSKSGKRQCKACWQLMNDRVAVKKGLTREMG